MNCTLVPLIEKTHIDQSSQLCFLREPIGTFFLRVCLSVHALVWLDTNLGVNYQAIAQTLPTIPSCKHTLKLSLLSLTFSLLWLLLVSFHANLHDPSLFQISNFCNKREPFDIVRKSQQENDTVFIHYLENVQLQGMAFLYHHVRGFTCPAIEHLCAKKITGSAMRMSYTCNYNADPPRHIS